jgi:hypothetical protein
MKKKSAICYLWALILAFFFSKITVAQTTSDTIQLKTVEVNQKKEKKLIKLLYNGYPAFCGINFLGEIVSPVKQVPEGELEAVVFYFNCGFINLFKNKLDIDYQDVTLKIVLYEMTNNGQPGEPIAFPDTVVIVPADHRGDFKVSLKEFHIKSQDLFIGFQILEPNGGAKNHLYMRLYEKEGMQSYTKFRNPKTQQVSTKWTSNFISHLKMKLYVKPF